MKLAANSYVNVKILFDKAKDTQGQGYIKCADVRITLEKTIFYK